MAAVRQRRLHLFAWLILACGCTGPSDVNASVPATPSAQSSTPHVTPSSSPTVRLAELGGLQFDLPPTLRFRADGWVSSGEFVAGFYSNVQLGAACHTFANGGSCGLPLDVLPPGAMLISWGNVSGLGITAQPAGEVPNTSIAGLAATITTDKPGACGAIHAEETITARIARTDGGDLLMRACLQSPDLSTAEQVVSAMLSSVTIGSA
jgi:hypothetical protein